jgi:CDP-diacylglycerol--glycerol-3-phosphate 3-phosphatidyltransferase
MTPLQRPKWQLRLPMQITYARIVLTVPVVFFMLSEEPFCKFLSVLIFSVAAASDYYDGYFARKFNATSNLGKFMDPIADKILVTSVLTVLLYLRQIDPFMALIIFARDNFISGIRSAAAADQLVLDAKNTGKWKTGVQMFGLPLLMINEIRLPGSWLNFPLDIHIQIGNWGYILLWIGALLSVLSGLQYFLLYLRSGRK